MEISKDMWIEMAHRLPNHKGKCANLHGHSYYIEMFVEGKVQTVKGKPQEGMVEDFALLKSAMCRIDEIFDHVVCLCVDDPLLLVISSMSPIRVEYIRKNMLDSPTSFVEFTTENTLKQRIVILPLPPTAEVLARVWGKIFECSLPKNVTLSRVLVKETSTSSVILKGDEI